MDCGSGRRVFRGRVRKESRMANYYLLETSSLALFLPFLPPAQQREAEQGRLRVVGAVEEDLAVGAAAFSRIGDTAQLAYLAVSPAYQKRGIATEMLRYLCSVLPVLDCFAVSVTLTAGHPAEAAMSRIMERLGGQREEGPVQVVCPISALRGSPLLSALLDKHSGRVVSLEQTAAISLRELDAQLLQKGAVSTHVDWSHFDPRLSFFGLDEHHKLNCCICAVREENGISVEWIYTTPSGAKTLIMAVLELLRVCEEEFPPDARFSAVLVDSGARKLLERLAGDKAEERAALRWYVEL